jgi:molybdenum cofactor cytidylyltransferase
MTFEAGGVTGVVPAAGASRRFGGAKLLADVSGAPLLQHTLRALLDGGVSRVVVVAAPGHELSAVPLLQDGRVSVAINADPGRGMFSSIQVGLAQLAPRQAALVMPADMPFVRAQTVSVVVAAYEQGGHAVVAAHGGRRGHPLIIPADVKPLLLRQDAGTTLKAALADLDVVPQEVPVDDPGVLRDVDVRGDL